MKTNSENRMIKYLLYLLFLLGGLLLGWLLFRPAAPAPAHDSPEDTQNATEWTCSMHPQIRQDKPGKCPICGMDLIPVHKHTAANGSGATDPDAIHLSEEAVALADVQTTRVSREAPVKQIRLYGKIVPDERALQSQTAHIGGRIESLNVDFTGETVRAGQTLATLYSPELFTAQQELIEAVRMGQAPVIQAAREKLRLWKMTDEQIAAIERSGVTSPLVEIKSNTNGIVLAKRVSQGDYVSQGAILFDVANLSKVWALFDAFEADLPFLGKGDPVTFTMQALPGKRYSGHISFIDPILNSATRTAKVRVEVPNASLELKPEMYATATVNAPLKRGGKEIVIPRTALLWTGKRSIVYVRQPGSGTPSFGMREVELGPALGDSYIVLGGLEEGEEIVTDGVFAIDASAQLEGKPSMMNRPEKRGEHAMFGVRGACGMCKQRIEQAALGVAGVYTAKWDQKAQMIHLQYDPERTSPAAISKAIAQAGHDTDMDKADQAVYDQLPACCHYREKK